MWPEKLDCDCSFRYAIPRSSDMLERPNQNGIGRRPNPNPGPRRRRAVPLAAEPLKEIPEASFDYSMIRATDFIRLIDEQRFWTRLFGQSSFSVGCQMMADFWARYRIIFPDYELFQRADRNQVDLSRCLPCLIHGDEGTYYKRSGIMIVQWQSLFGKGTSLLGREAFADRLLGENNSKAYVNQRGVTLTTRFLLGVLPKDLSAVRSVYRII